MLYFFRGAGLDVGPAQIAIDETVIVLTLSPSLLIHLLEAEGGAAE